MTTDSDFVRRMEEARGSNRTALRRPATFTEPRSARIPPGGWKPEATPAEVLEVACPLCGVSPGEPCDRSKYLITALPFAFPRQGYSMHTARYLRRVRGEDWRRRG